MLTSSNALVGVISEKKEKKRKTPVGDRLIIDIVTGCMLSNEPKSKIPKADAKCRK